MMKSIVGLLVCMLALMIGATAAAEMPLMNVSRDFNGDGYPEGQVVMSGKEVVKTLLDTNNDRTIDAVISYKNGYREKAEVDANQDGKPDTWIFYYFTGVPWKIAEDYNGDGQADYWVFLKNGQTYKWEQDRNFDGKPDVQTILDPDQKTGQKAVTKIIRQTMDDDFDGFFENTVRGMNRKAADLRPQSLAEALLK